jgi:hypothetical protein
MDLDVKDDCDNFLYSYPCHHYVEIGNFKGNWDAVQICQYYIDNSWPIPDHFKQYVKTDYVKCENLKGKYGRYYIGIQTEYFAHFGPGYKYNIPKEILNDPGVKIIYLH